MQGARGVRFLVPSEGEQDTSAIDMDETGLSDTRGQTLHISGSVNIESCISIGCSGAIITYLQRRKAVEYLTGDTAADEAYQILRLEMFSLKDTMYV